MRASQQTASLHSLPPACNDISKIDVRNMNLRVFDRTFSFHNGVAWNDAESDSPGNQNEQQFAWKAEIEQDAVVQPSSDTVVRFLLIHDSHQTGSGWQNYVVGLRCAGGQVHNVFQKRGLSLKIVRLDSSEVSVENFRNRGDAKPVIQSYFWNGEKYVAANRNAP